MSGIGEAAMVLAAGLGMRMRPLSDARPKPLIQVNGKALIDYAFDRLREAGVKKAVVNVHYLAGQIVAWSKCQASPALEISDEQAEILDTGGGIALALPRLGPNPFFVLNSDSFWIDGTVPALRRLRAAWDGARMDCLLLLCPLDRTVGYDGKGDFVIGPNGRLARRTEDAGTVLVYAGCHLVDPRLFRDAPSGKFSMNLLWDRAIAKGKLFGLAHDGKWIHVGTPAAIAGAEAALRE
ncbi:MAG: nucleotidyltransferase family protein [Hyphomicrobiales bacterium]